VGSRFKIVQDLEKVLKEFVDEFSWTDIPLAAMFSAVCEELFFRLFLLNILGLVASSLVFGILHFPIKKELQLWTVFAFIMGFILGAFYIYFGLISAITLHFCVNLVNLIRLKRR
jgi:membrane protease YdiL (CAAX protease family)